MGLSSFSFCNCYLFIIIIISWLDINPIYQTTTCFLKFSKCLRNFLNFTFRKNLLESIRKLKKKLAKSVHLSSSLSIAATLSKRNVFFFKLKDGSYSRFIYKLRGLDFEVYFLTDFDREGGCRSRFEFFTCYVITFTWSRDFDDTFLIESWCLPCCLI